MDLRRWLRLAAAIVVDVSVLVALWFSGHAELKAIEAPEGQVAAPMPAPPPVSASGTLTPTRTIDIRAERPGRIVEVTADHNAFVSEGTVLVRLDPEPAEAGLREARAMVAEALAALEVRAGHLERARAELARARNMVEVAASAADGAQVGLDEATRELKRAQELAARGSLATRELDRAQALRQVAAVELDEALAKVRERQSAVRAAEAEVGIAEAQLREAEATVERIRALQQIAKLELERTIIRSPIDGIVLARDAQPGETVSAGPDAPVLLTLGDQLSQMEVHARIDEADVGRVQAGQAADFTVDAYPQRAFVGVVSQIRSAPRVVQNVVMYTAVIVTANSDRALLPGMTAIVRFKPATARPGISAAAADAAATGG